MVSKSLNFANIDFITQRHTEQTLSFSEKIVNSLCISVTSLCVSVTSLCVSVKIYFTPPVNSLHDPSKAIDPHSSSY